MVPRADSDSNSSDDIEIVDAPDRPTAESSTTDDRPRGQNASNRPSFVDSIMRYYETGVLLQDEPDTDDSEDGEPVHLMRAYEQDASQDPTSEDGALYKIRSSADVQCLSCPVRDPLLMMSPRGKLLTLCLYHR